MLENGWVAWRGLDSPDIGKVQAVTRRQLLSSCHIDGSVSPLVSPDPFSLVSTRRVDTSTCFAPDLGILYSWP